MKIFYYSGLPFADCDFPLIKEYQNGIYNGNSNISMISIQGNNTIDLKKKQLYFIPETTKKFFISNY